MVKGIVRAVIAVSICVAPAVAFADPCAPAPKVPPSFTLHTNLDPCAPAPKVPPSVQ